MVALEGISRQSAKSIGMLTPVLDSLPEKYCTSCQIRDEKSLLIDKRGIPLRVMRVYMDSKRREDVLQLSLSDPAGIVSVGGARLTPDLKTYAYTYFRTLSDLYVVDGVR